MFSPSIQIEIDAMESASQKTQHIVSNLHLLLPTVTRNKKQEDQIGSTVDKLLQIYPDSIPIERAVAEASERQMKQPGLILIGDSFFLKLEMEAVKLDVGGLPDGLAHLVASYYIFDCAYPDPLKFVFGFFERVFDLSIDVLTIKRNMTISDFFTKVAAYADDQML